MEVIMVIVFLTIFVYSLISLLKVNAEKRKNAAKINELAKSNEFILKNREKYEKIIENNSASLSSERKRESMQRIITVIACAIPLVLYFIYQEFIFIILLLIVIVVFGLIFTGKSVQYYSKSKNIYTETVRTILKELDSNLEYDPDKGFDNQEYMSLYFGETCDRFISSDTIINNQTGFVYSDILIEEMEIDDDGHTHYVSQYDGSIAKMGIKNIGCTIILAGNYILRKTDEFNEILFENDEFNEDFLCFTDDELTTYKVLTPDIMEEFVNIKKNTIGNIDIRIINDKLYIRFSGTNGFDGKEDSKEELFKSVAVLDEIMKTMDKVKKIIESKTMN